MKTYHYTHGTAIKNVVAATATIVLVRFLLNWESDVIADTLPFALISGVLLYMYNYWHLFNESIEMGRDGFTLKKRIGKDREFPYADVKRVIVKETGKKGWLANWSDEELHMTLADRTGGSSDVRLTGLDDREDFIRRVKNGVEDRRGKMIFQDSNGEIRMSLRELVDLEASRGAARDL